MTENGRIQCPWPSPANQPERAAAIASRFLTDKPHREWRHAQAPVLRIGADSPYGGFWLYTTAGHVVRFLRLSGASDERIEAFVAGQLPDEEIAELYRTTHRWVKQSIDEITTLGLPALLPRLRVGGGGTR